MHVLSEQRTIYNQYIKQQGDEAGRPRFHFFLLPQGRHFTCCGIQAQTVNGRGSQSIRVIVGCQTERKTTIHCHAEPSDDPEKGIPNAKRLDDGLSIAVH